MDTLYKWEKFLGVWGETNRTTYPIKLTLNIVLVVYALVGMVIHLVNVISDPTATVADISDAVYSLQICCNFFFNYIMRLVFRKSSFKFFESLQTFEFGEPTALDERNTQTNLHVKLMLCYCVAGSITADIYYLVIYHWCNKQHSVGEISYCGYFFGMHFPYDIDGGVSFLIHKIIAVYANGILCANGILFICAGYAGIECIVIQIDHLREMLAQVQKIADQRLMLHHLKTCIKYHIHIIGLADQLNSCYSAINTPALFFYSVTLGICFFNISKEFTFKTSLLIGGYLMGIFLMTAAGQKLIDASESVAFAAYGMKWYEMDAKTRRYILLIIIRSQRALGYKGGPFGVFSRVVFMNIIRSSYTYMTMQSNTN